MIKKALVLGAGGFIGSHLVSALKAEGYWVRGVDLKAPEFSPSQADDFIIGDLRLLETCHKAFNLAFDEVYQLAADMGGAGYIFTGDNDAAVMHNSALINLNTVEACRINNIRRVFYSSSACVYPEYNQLDADNPNCEESSVYPAAPDSEYGWEKLFSERLYLSFDRNTGVEARIGRFHNIFGEEGTWQGGKEKVPAAMCRKVALAQSNDQIEIWGDGEQTRSFLHISEAVEAVLRLTRSDWSGPVNIGSEEAISINGLAAMVMNVAGKQLPFKHIDGPLGVRGRNSDNRLMKKMLGWQPGMSLRQGIEKTYPWILAQTRQRQTEAVVERCLEGS